MAQLLRINEKDNVLLAAGRLEPGPVNVNGSAGQVVLLDAVTLGHKVAARPIGKGEKIIKYGVSIGSATRDIPEGAHVHVHNMKSDYTPTHSLQETAGGRA